MRLILFAGSTETASIEGISAAGADPALMRHTPSADAEILAYGQPVRAPVVPVSPSGCPTPAILTRAAREVLGFTVTVVDAGLAEKTGAPTVSVGARPGADIREADPVATAPGAFAAAREFGRELPDEHVVVGETVPGGTTTAMGVLRALGEDATVSSSFPENPLEQKREVVREGLAASGLDPGDCAGDPREAVRRMGDPVLAAVAGFTLGALESGASVTLGGGTQLLTAGALVRHAGCEAPLELATTSFVADDVDDLADAAGRLDLDLTVTDPGFGSADHVAMARYVAGEAKEGVGLGGALALADRAGALAAVREAIPRVYDAVVGEEGDHAP
ncbi:nicotinate-nucleotide--dimethylbenzimidazole phosphoribosyltransferase [Haloarchaeobius amylolyticus]|uniref:nicotinate-nucleotide--dimethylbenzimidazole phosphoribosyltransferase n=1 Tax=Haloarchaeobius amylolyticus TaxID=1198296 RepID=UPI00226F167A|nr:TIGR00303 family protein [Haloarchaeobius amylolyticus]